MAGGVHGAKFAEGLFEEQGGISAGRGTGAACAHKGENKIQSTPNKSWLFDHSQ